MSDKRNDIEMKYKMFGISNEKLPEYIGPEDFACLFKKCSILKDTNVGYATNSNIQHQEKEFN